MEQEKFDDINKVKPDQSEEERSKLIAETLKIDAERKKVELETQELEKRLKVKWYRSKTFAQGLVAGFVAMPLIWFYMTQIAIPIYQSDNVKLGLLNEQTKKDLNVKKDSINRMAVQLDSQRISFLVELDNLRVQNQTMQQNLEASRRQIDTISTLFQINAQLKERFEKKIDTLNQSISKYSANNKKLLGQIASVSNQSYSMNPKDETNLLRFDGLYERKDSSEDYWGYIRFFENGKAIDVSVIAKLDQMPNWMNLENNTLGNGPFTISGTDIRFTTNSSYGKIDFTGKIFKDMIVLNHYSHINKHRAEGLLYRFVPLK